MQCPVQDTHPESRHPSRTGLCPETSQNVSSDGRAGRGMSWGYQEVPVAELGALGGMEGAGAGMNRHSCDSHTLHPPRAGCQQLLAAAARGSRQGKREEGAAGWAQPQQSAGVAEQDARAGESPCPCSREDEQGFLSSPGAVWRESSEAAAPARSQPGRERPRPRCLCSLGVRLTQRLLLHSWHLLTD